MGGKHSKRSVDISTPSAEKDDVSEKVEGDNKLQNGTFHIEELNEKEEKPKDQCENTEEQPQNESDADKKLETTNNKKKKKWSFRSLSFSKKDKSKPAMVKEETKPDELAPSKSSQEETETVEQKEDCEESQDNLHPAEESSTEAKKSEDKLENPEELQAEPTKPMKEDENLDSDPAIQSDRKEEPDDVTNNERKDESGVESVQPNNERKEDSGVESFQASTEQKIILEEKSIEEESSETKIEKTSVIKTNNISITEISVLKTECTQEINMKIEGSLALNESLDLNNETEEINGAGESLADELFDDNNEGVKENGLPDAKDLKTIQVLGESEVQQNGENITTKAD
ncbi:HIV Tat-specific factor 1 isoform X2 [Cimex lectularius]|nr:HIV Tat-specific factor 1 isoform X2 [Cimex lectularius]XP_014255908.1 HIV Tat-specific factor 1 isoform X2 [Cimex lectularius]